jgi:hypothetical protein
MGKYREARLDIHPLLGRASGLSGPPDHSYRKCLCSCAINAEVQGSGEPRPRLEFVEQSRLTVESRNGVKVGLIPAET